MYIKKVNYCHVLHSVQDRQLRAGKPPKGPGSAQDLVQFTVSSQVIQLWLTTAASVQALARTANVLPQVQLICAEEIFQLPVSATSAVVGGNL